jgi:hypothetical protein
MDDEKSVAHRLEMRQDKAEAFLGLLIEHGIVLESDEVASICSHKRS